MTIKQLKEQIARLPDDMPVVVSQNDNPDLANCKMVNIEYATEHSEYGYNYAGFGNDKLPTTVKVAVINGH